MQPRNPLAEESFILPSGEIGRSLRDRILSGNLDLRPKSRPDLLLPVTWSYCPTARDPMVRLTYQMGTESPSYAVRLDMSDCFSGIRTRALWRFVCLGCGERSDKLYLPANAGHQKYFLCRLCWGIDYLLHVRPRRASMSAIKWLGNKIQTIEAELLKLRRLHSGLLQSLGLR